MTRFYSLGFCLLCNTRSNDWTPWLDPMSCRLYSQWWWSNRWKTLSNKEFLTSICNIFYWQNVHNNKTIIPLTLVGYEMVMTNSVQHTPLAIYHFTSIVFSWNNLVQVWLLTCQFNILSVLTSHSSLTINLRWQISSCFGEYLHVTSTALKGRFLEKRKSLTLLLGKELSSIRPWWSSRLLPCYYIILFIFDKKSNPLTIPFRK